MTDGLSAGCAQCIVENSGFKGKFCEVGSPDVCGGDGCICDYGPSGESCDDVGSCTPEDDACFGFSIEESTSSDCADACGS